MNAFLPASQSLLPDFQLTVKHQQGVIAVGTIVNA